MLLITTRITPTFSHANADKTITASSSAGTSVSWSTSNESVATVSGGKITAKASGTVIITASTTSGAKATCTVTVNNATSSVSWSSSNTSVATVSSGTVTGVARGSATITATAGGKSGTYAITVKKAYKSIALTTSSQYAHFYKDYDQTGHYSRGMYLYPDSGTSQFIFEFITTSDFTSHTDSGCLYRCTGINAYSMSQDGCHVEIQLSSTWVTLYQWWNGSAASVALNYSFQNNTYYKLVLEENNSGRCSIRLYNESGTVIAANEANIGKYSNDGYSYASIGPKPGINAQSSVAPRIYLVGLYMNGYQGAYNGNRIYAPDIQSKAITETALAETYFTALFVGTSVQWLLY